MSFKIKEWWLAWLGDKRWPFCSWCWIRVLWADDCGFMYLHPFPRHYPWKPYAEQVNDPRNNRPCCKHCYFGIPGVAHTNRHGVGER